MNNLHWELWYFNYWLTHLFYFAAGLFVIISIGSRKYSEYRKKIKLLERLEKYSYPNFERRYEKWVLNQ